jgi:multiple sugar transport system permease protein
MRFQDSRFKRALTYLLVIVALSFFLFPIYWLIRTSALSIPEIYSVHVFWFPQTIKNYLAVWAVPGLPADYGHSVIVATVATVATILMAIPVSFSLARLSSRKSAARYLDSLLLGIALPPIVLIIPFYLIMSSLNLVDTILGLILIEMVFNLPFSVWLTYSFFKDIPISIEESGIIDGCSRLGAFVRLELPLAVTGLAVAAIFVYILSWNDFLFALVLTRKSAVTAPIAILDLILGTEGGETTPSWALASAAGVWFMLPVAVLTVFMNRYLAKALTLGGVKE